FHGATGPRWWGDDRIELQEAGAFKSANGEVGGNAALSVGSGLGVADAVDTILIDLFHACSEDAGVDGFGHDEFASLSGCVFELEDGTFGGCSRKAGNDGECRAEFEFCVSGFDDEFGGRGGLGFRCGLVCRTFRAGDGAAVAAGGHHTGDHQQKAAGADEGPDGNLSAGDDAGPVASVGEQFGVFNGHLGKDSRLESGLGEDLYGGQEGIVEFGVGAFHEPGRFDGSGGACEQAGEKDAGDGSNGEDDQFGAESGGPCAEQQHGKDCGKEQCSPRKGLAPQQPQANDAPHDGRQFSFQTATTHSAPCFSSDFSVCCSLSLLSSFRLTKCKSEQEKRGF
ncbi:MAG: hypothetical protein RL215_854, partial [Planctomycetota bacterium]